MSNHRLCDHETTPAARRACRKQNEAQKAATITTTPAKQATTRLSDSKAPLAKKIVAARTFNGKTAAEWRAEAQKAREAEAESFDRCDTDGFLSQWAHRELERHYKYCATIAENDGRVTYPALFDLDGNHIPAKEIPSKYGIRYFVFDPAGINGERYVSISLAQNDETARKNNAKRGFYFGSAMYKATVAKRSTEIYVDDADYQNDVIILDNGH